MNNLRKINIFISLSLIPSIAFGAPKIPDLINAVFGIVNNILIPLAFALCLAYFFWGVAIYIKSEGDKKEEGRRVMFYGIVALFVAFSIWGIIRFMRSELSIPDIQKTRVLKV